MKIGILGGGQLGRMFMQNAINYPYTIGFLEPDAEASCSIFKNSFTVGDFKDYTSVLNFGKDKDVISIEIENVNVEALKELRNQGKKIIPSPECLELIKDKGLQKEFYKENHLPSSDFYTVQNRNELLNHPQLKYPFVQKLRVGGYDGKGVQIIKNAEDLQQVWDEPSVIENVVPIKKELSVIISRNENGESCVFDVVEMVFDETLNLVDYLLSPAEIDDKIKNVAKDISIKVIEALNTPGIFCVELFLLEDDSVIINEIAPRVHNSGHPTIEANSSSQYDQMLRVLANLPLGDVCIRECSAMVNVIGDPKQEGEAEYVGIEDLISLPQTYLHLYGKRITKPGRKMGHVTVLGKNKEEIVEKINFIKSKFKVIAQ
ncbi:5-(carboxyamino)imidazole ribonucleotide synthase [Apibacter muscae]|uniref:N5-carboxyaminoimidazole ribonucleotide synthase n=1 Tax=Apibacter muscae TaxID=2509004 RepID=A0A563DIU3_9FLAO|nr:5-(carboxyamino)imidazole ribonucleotide synthase [Apibacter muscae]TWP29734.1 5-(carboxyamino)imidazole ribonucleotide synthase [Apibacter muscae]